MPISDEDKQPDDAQTPDKEADVPEQEGPEVVVGEATIEAGPSTSEGDPLGDKDEEDEEEEEKGDKDDEDYEPENMTEEEYLEYINKDGEVS